MARNTVKIKCIKENLFSIVSNVRNISFTANFVNVKYKVPITDGINSLTKGLSHILRDKRIPTHAIVKLSTTIAKLNLHVSNVYVSISGSLRAQTIAIPLTHNPIPAFSET